MMQFDIEAKASFKWFAVLQDFPLHICNLVEYIQTNRILFFLALSRFVVQQDQIGYRHRTLSSTAPATSTSFNHTMPKFQAENRKILDFNQQK
jgi:hypothetical protein